MTSRRLGRPRNHERPDRIGDITTAAIAQFGEHGYGGTTFSAVARAAGLTPAALYRYFDDKAALYLHAARVAREATWTMLGERFRPAGSLVADFQAMIELLLEIRKEPASASALRLLSSLQATAIHHRELAPLLEERWQVRHTIVGDIGRRAFASGGLTGFDDAEDAALAIEIVFSGLSTEMYANPKLRHRLASAALETVRGLQSRSVTPI